MRNSVGMRRNNNNKKGGVAVPKSETYHFISPTSPQNGGIAFGFKRLPLLDGFKAHFEMLLYFFWVNFEAIFPFMLTSTDPPTKMAYPVLFMGL